MVYPDAPGSPQLEEPREGEPKELGSLFKSK